jgi:hypothetical protein
VRVAAGNLQHRFAKHTSVCVFVAATEECMYVESGVEITGPKSEEVSGG